MKNENLVEGFLSTGFLGRAYRNWMKRYEPPIHEPKDLNEALVYILILNLLQNEDESGYRLLERMREIMDRHFSWEEVKIYLFLKRFENEKSLASYWRKSSSERIPKYYSITNRGISRLEELKSHFIDKLKIHYPNIMDRMGKK